MDFRQHQSRDRRPDHENLDEKDMPLLSVAGGLSDAEEFARIAEEEESSSSAPSFSICTHSKTQCRSRVQNSPSEK